MPRQIIRNYRALAERQNYAAWGELPPPATDFERACIPAFEESAHRNQSKFLNERRARLVRAIEATSFMPSQFWCHPYFRELPMQPLTSVEAVEAIRHEMGRERRRKGHWSHKPERLLTLAEAMVFSRFFRRFGRAVWMKEAA